MYKKTRMINPLQNIWFLKKWPNWIAVVRLTQTEIRTDRVLYRGAPFIKVYFFYQIVRSSFIAQVYVDNIKCLIARSWNPFLCRLITCTLYSTQSTDWLCVQNSEYRLIMCTVLRVQTDYVYSTQSTDWLCV